MRIATETKATARAYALHAHFALSFLFIFAGTLQAQQPVSVDNPHVKHVVHVRCDLSNGNIGWGSGVWIDESHVLTALHVVTCAERIEVKWQDERIVAQVKYIEPAADWALLQTEPTEKTPAIVLREEPITNGEQVTGYGFGTPTNGRRFLCQITGKANMQGVRGSDKPRGGDSGGPVFDANGRLVGVINAHIEGEPVWFGYGMKLNLKAFCEGKRGFRR